MLDVVFLTIFFFFFNDTATTEIYTLSLHDALPISAPPRAHGGDHARASGRVVRGPRAHRGRGPPRGARGGVVPRGRAAGRADRRGRERSRVDGRRRGKREA